MINGPEFQAPYRQDAGAMTMRDYFASAAMQVILSYRLHHPITDEQIANGAYEIADAMMAERAKR